MNEFDFVARARAIRKRQLAVSEYIPDEVVNDYADFFAFWAPYIMGADGEPVAIHYNVGDRRRFNDAIYRCLQAHDSQEAWNPVDAPSLWAKVLTDPNGEILDWQQPESTNPYDKGDRVKHNGKIYESLVSGNVWEPGTVGTESLWKEVTD